MPHSKKYVIRKKYEKCRNCGTTVEVRYKVYEDGRWHSSITEKTYVNVAMFPSTKKKPFVFCGAKCKEEWMYNGKSS